MSAPDPDDVLRTAHVGDGWYVWPPDHDRLRRHQLEPAIFSAWDPCNSSWPAQVEAYLDHEDSYEDHPSLTAQERNANLR